MGDANRDPSQGCALWQELIKELEQATAQLEHLASGDLLALAQAVQLRARAIAKVHEYATRYPPPATPELLRRLQADYARGALILERLRVARANAQAEIAQLAERTQLWRSLRTSMPRFTRNVDVEG